MQKIFPHLWYDTEALEAAEFYVKAFGDGSKIINKAVIHDTPSGDCDIVNFSLKGFEFQAISAGPLFQFTPAISFMVVCQSVEEVDALYEKLIDGGKALMELDAYPFSPRYGWVMDRYGLTWQLIFIEGSSGVRNIMPTMMFIGENYGKAEEAMNFYTSLFDDTEMGNISRYGEGKSPDRPEAIAHGEFKLEGQWFSIMDSAYDHQFAFNEAISFLVHAETQEEIDRLWGQMSVVPEAEQCGWLKDKYGVSWQISPRVLGEMMSCGDQQKVDRVTQAFLQMKKFDIAALEKAYDGE